MSHQISSGPKVCLPNMHDMIIYVWIIRKCNDVDFFLNKTVFGIEKILRNIDRDVLYIMFHLKKYIWKETCKPTQLI